MKHPRHPFGHASIFHPYLKLINRRLRSCAAPTLSTCFLHQLIEAARLIQYPTTSDVLIYTRGEGAQLFLDPVDAQWVVRAIRAPLEKSAKTVTPGCEALEQKPVLI